MMTSEGWGPWSSTLPVASRAWKRGAKDPRKDAQSPLGWRKVTCPGHMALTNLVLGCLSLPPAQSCIAKTCSHQHFTDGETEAQTQNDCVVDTFCISVNLKTLSFSDNFPLAHGSKIRGSWFVQHEILQNLENSSWLGSDQ
jgi:hypothetical protein